MQGSVNIAEVWLMSNSTSRIAYKNWFNSSFTGEEINLLSSIGVECKADHNFFKFEILDIASDIKNYKLKTKKNKKIKSEINKKPKSEETKNNIRKSLIEYYEKGNILFQRYR